MDALTRTEIWLVEHGLPSFTRRAVGGSSRRVGSLLVLVVGVELALVAPSRSWPWWLDLLAVLAGPALGTAVLRAALDVETRRGSAPLWRLSGDLAFITVPASAAFVLASPRAAAGVGLINLGVLALLALDQRLGVLAVLRWSARHGTGQVRFAAARLSRSVPLLTVVILALFFTSEVWQAAAGLSGANLSAVVLVLGAAGVLFAVSQARTGLAARVVAADDAAVALTPAAELAPNQGPVPPLTRLEEANVNVLLMVSQLCVVAATSLMFAALIIVLGSVAIPVQVLATWLGAEPMSLIDLHLGVQVHLTRELLALGAVMAGVAGLVFAVSLAGDEAFQDSTRDQLAQELASAMAARSRYLAAVDRPAT